MIGSTISHYRVTGKLGEGGMGVVYKAEDTRLGRTVALKLLPSGLESDSARARFVREAQAAAALNHPNICPIHEIDEVDGVPFFAMAYVEGPTFAELSAGGAFPVGRAISLAIDVARGLEAAHQRGIVHRDIKSNNLVAAKEGHAVILDFGLALHGEDNRLTRPGAVVGSPSYMSPEQAQGLPVDHRTDIWSLGAVLFELLAGRPPFARESTAGLLYAIVHQPPAPLREFRPDVSPELDRAVSKALAKDPGARWQSAAQMASALEQLRTGSLGPTVALTEVAVPAPRRSRRHWWIAAASAAGAAAIALTVQFARTDSSKQVAVLPLALVGADETVRTLADGLVETLTSRLAQAEDASANRRLMVVPASEIRARKILSAEEARRIYGATYVITGHAQRIGGKVQFTLNLIDAKALRQLGTQVVDFDAANPLALRDRAVAAARQLLEIELPAGQGAGDTSQPAAYTKYLEGRGFLARYDKPGNIDHALESLRSAVESDPKYALAYTALAEAYWRKASATADRHWADRAVESAERAAQIEPGLVLARARLADIYGRVSRHDDAIREAKKALDAAPADPEAQRALASSYAAIGKFKEAEAAYIEAVRQRPTDWYSRLLLGYFYQQRSRYPEAEAAFKEAQKLTPDNDVVLRNLGGVTMLSGRFAEAADLFKRSLKFDRSARTFNALGVTLYYQHRFAEAASALEAAIDLDSSGYIFWGNLGTVHRRTPDGKAKAAGEFTRAIELAGKALEVTPGNPNVHANLAEYRSKLGDKDGAYREIAAIPEAVRGPYFDRIALAYEVAGDRKRAAETIRKMAESKIPMTTLRADPELEALWKDPALRAIDRP